MKKSSILAFTFVLSLLAACGRTASDAEVQDDTTNNPDMIALQDGTIMRVSCVKAKAAAIVAQGRGAADSCVMGNAKKAADSSGRGFGGNYPSWWSSYYVYPPYYYGGNYNNLCSYLGFSSYGYGSSYRYGSGSDYNCYSSFLGYDTSYTYDYSDSCDSCLTKPNPTRCYNRCLYRSGWYW